MSCSLPQEILDLVIDHLRDEPKTLQTCCVVSKAWVERTRKHLFVQVKFRPLRRRVCRWRETFPDPTNSPARHARTLSICHPQFITAADADTILTFCGVVHLNVDTDLWHDQGVSLALLHGFSPVIRSLHLTFTSLPNSKIFDLVCSLPLLEDLALVSRTHRHSDMPWNPPSTSPRLTGSLELRLIEGIQITTYRLLDFPNGLHFTKIVVLWRSGGDVLSTMHLVSRCSGTLESLDIADHLLNASGPSSLDLSKATKLQDIVYRCTSSNVQRITAALHTVESKNLQQISLELLRCVFWHTAHQELSNLDSLLVQLWTSHSLRLKVMYESSKGLRDPREHVATLLPELTRRGIIDLVEQAFPGMSY